MGKNSSSLSLPQTLSSSLLLAREGVGGAFRFLLDRPVCGVQGCGLKDRWLEMYIQSVMLYNSMLMLTQWNLSIRTPLN